MVSILTWIKNQITYFIKSIPDIIKGLILFILIVSGLSFAILLRLLDQGGIVISIVGIFIEIFAIILIYFLFRKYLKSEEKSESSELRKK
ncbi:MAG: hypothetical protein ACFFBP_06695 [Promethearchaeota archaeon]